MTQILRTSSRPAIVTPVDSQKTFLDLPQTIVRRIAAKLPKQDIVSLSTSCSTVHGLLTKSAEFLVFYLRETKKLNSAELESYAARLSKHFRKRIWPTEMLCNYCPNLEELDLTDLQDRELVDLIQRTPKLRKLTLKNAMSITSRGVIQVLRNCRSLERLDLTGCINIGPAAFCDFEVSGQDESWGIKELVLRHCCLAVTDECLRAVSASCPNLSILDISRNEYFSAEGIAAIATLLKLRSLNLSKCYQMDNSFLKPLRNAPLQLETLSLKGCFLIDDLGFCDLESVTANLDFLDVTGCPITSRALGTLIKPGSRLRTLILSKCGNVDNSALSSLLPRCQLLETLDLSYSPQIGNISLKILPSYCPHLRTLNLSYCPKISGEGLEPAVSGLTKLSSLALAGEKVTDREIQAIIPFAWRLGQIRLENCDLSREELATDLYSRVNKPQEQPQTAPPLTDVREIKTTLLDLPITIIQQIAGGLSSWQQISKFAATCRKIDENLKNRDAILAHYLAQAEALTAVELQSYSARLTRHLQEDVTIEDLLRNYRHHLQELDLSDWRLRDETLAPLLRLTPELRALKLKNSPLITYRSILEVLRSCPELRRLDLTGCSDVSPISEGALASLSDTLRLQELILREIPLSDEGLRAIFAKCPDLQVVDLSQNCLAYEGATSALAGLSHLRSLNFSQCPQVDNTMLQRLRGASFQLEALNLAGCNKIGERGFDYLEPVTRRLSFLDLSGCQVTKKVLDVLVEGGSPLRILILSQCQNLEDGALSALLTRCGLLETLNVSHCPAIGNSWLKSLPSCCPELTSLDLSHCPNISGEGLEPAASGLNKLSSLALAGEYVTDREIQALIPSAHRIEHLVLSRTSEKLSAKALYQLFESMPNLRTLQCDECSSFSGEHLEALAQYCPHLVSLNVSGNKVSDRGITLLSKGCHQLEQLYLADCKGVSDASVTYLSEECPHLRELSLCRTSLTYKSLESIAQNSHFLRSLDLSGCKEIRDHGVRMLLQHSTKLRQLSLDECRITDFAFEPLGSSQVKLEVLKVNNCPKLTNKTLWHLSQRSEELRALYIRGNKNLQEWPLFELTERAPNLSTLKSDVDISSASAGLFPRTLKRLSALPDRMFHNIS